MNETHDPKRRAWLDSACATDSDFPVQNLPFGAFEGRGGVAIGDRIVDLQRLSAAGLVSGDAAEAARAAAGPTLNPLLALPQRFASALRARLSSLLSDPSCRARVEPCLVAMAGVRLDLPVAVGAYTDFLCSLDHTLRMGRGNLPPAFKHLPIAYNGRATSVRASGHPVRRPNGQHKAGEAVRFGPEPALDYELEFAMLVGEGNALGEPLSVDAAAQRIFGYCLLNDWSARNIQTFESTPLGPFLGKSFLTTVSPWIVTTDALAPFRTAAAAHDIEVPAYLRSSRDQAEGGLAIDLEAEIVTPKGGRERLSRTSLRNMYWTFAQMLAHHSSNGCNLGPGDMLGSGTLSGAADESRACLAELTDRGAKPVTLANGEKRAWLEDGDEVVFRARASRDGFVPIGFGECRGRIEPAVRFPS
jgi:fumarylacetoacetase